MSMIEQKEPRNVFPDLALGAPNHLKMPIAHALSANPCSDEEGELMSSIVEEQLESIRIDRSDPSRQSNLCSKIAALRAAIFELKLECLEGSDRSNLMLSPPAHRCTCGVRVGGGQKSPFGCLTRLSRREKLNVMTEQSSFQAKVPSPHCGLSTHLWNCHVS